MDSYGEEEAESEEEFAYQKKGGKGKDKKKKEKNLSAFADYEEFAHLLEEGVDDD